RDGYFGSDFLMPFGSLKERVAVFALYGKDIWEALYDSALFKLLQSLDYADKKCSVSQRHKDILRHSAHLLIHLIYVCLCSLIKEGVKHMAGVINSLFFHLFSTHSGTFIPGARHHIHLCPVCLYHGNLFGRCAFWHKYLTFYARFGAVCRHAVACVAS